MPLSGDAKRRAARIELLIWDVDGVLTSGGITYDASGGELKTFNVLDGAAIRRLQQVGIASAIITGRESAAVARRAEELGIELLFQGRGDKTGALQEIFNRTGLPREAVAHCGDDLPDLALFDAVGFAFSVPNGHPTVRRAADYVTTTTGGAGVAREIEELLLRARGEWTIDAGTG